MTALKLAVAGSLIALAVGGAKSCAVAPTNTGASGPTVTDTSYVRDSNNPATGTHYASCRNPGGSSYQVVITAAQGNGGLHNGDPCPAGAYLPMPQDQFPDIWSALTQPLPYNGGDPNGPCGSWSAADKADADQMAAEYQQCMATHH